MRRFIKLAPVEQGNRVFTLHLYLCALHHRLLQCHDADTSSCLAGLIFGDGRNHFHAGLRLALANRHAVSLGVEAHHEAFAQSNVPAQ